MIICSYIWYILSVNKSKKCTTEQKLIAAAIVTASQHGLSNFSVKQAADCAGVSEALYYKYFGNRNSLIQKCAEHIEIMYCRWLRVIAEEYHENLEKEEQRYRLWSVYISFLIENGNSTVFAYEFLYSRSLDSGILKRIDNDVCEVPLVQKLREVCTGLDDLQFEVRRKTLRLLALDYAVAVVWGRVSDSPRARQSLWNTMRHGNEKS